MNHFLANINLMRDLIRAIRRFDSKLERHVKLREEKIFIFNFKTYGKCSYRVWVNGWSINQ